MRVPSINSYARLFSLEEEETLGVSLRSTVQNGGEFERTLRTHSGLERVPLFDVDGRIVQDTAPIRRSYYKHKSEEIYRTYLVPKLQHSQLISALSPYSGCVPLKERRSTHHLPLTSYRFGGKSYRTRL